MGAWRDQYNRVRPHSISGLPTTRTRWTGGHRTTATHIHNHAVGSQRAWSKITVRSKLHGVAGMTHLSIASAGLTPTARSGLVEGVRAGLDHCRAVWLSRAGTMRVK
jgi:hypothetical protein